MNLKKCLACVLAFWGLFQFSANAITADSITFYKNETWANILSIATTQQKMIFVDVYTSWCGPCKAMDKKTFKEADVATYFNQNFINVKLDAEKGEGVELSKKYAVNSYPTYLFLDNQGNLLATFGGFMKGDKFLSKTKEIQQSIQNLATLEQTYNAGKREPAFLAMYAKALQMAGKPFVAVFDEYWQARNKPTEPTTQDLQLAYQLISNADRDFIDYKSTLIQTCLQNHEALTKIYRKDSVRYAMSGILKENVRYYTRQKKEQDFEALLGLLAQQESKKKINSKEEKQFRLEFYEETAQWERYFPIALDMNKDFEKDYSLKKIAAMDSLVLKMMKYMKEKENNDVLADMDLKEISMKSEATEVLCEFAWNFYEHTENPAYLQEALKWTTHALMLDEDAFTLTTHAHLLEKNKRKKEAVKTAQKAIQKADKELLTAKDEEDKKDIQEMKDKANALLDRLNKKKK